MQLLVEGVDLAGKLRQPLLGPILADVASVRLIRLLGHSQHLLPGVLELPLDSLTIHRGRLRGSGNGGNFGGLLLSRSVINVAMANHCVVDYPATAPPRLPQSQRPLGRTDERRIVGALGKIVKKRRSRRRCLLRRAR